MEQEAQGKNIVFFVLKTPGPGCSKVINVIHWIIRYPEDRAKHFVNTYLLDSVDWLYLPYVENIG